MTDKRRTALSDFLVILAVFMVSRAVFAFLLGVVPDPAYLETHWQNLDPANLEADLFGSLVSLHSQPPVWNAVLGAAAKLCSARTDCMVSALHVFNMGLSLIAALCLLGLLRTFFSRAVSLLVVLAYLLSPSVIYYENYIFYPQLTATLAALVALSLLRLLNRKTTALFIATLASLVVLSLVWSIFHPALVALLILLILFRTGSWSGARLTLAGLALFLTLLPSIKNQAVFGFFGSGSWLGLNLSQVAPDQPKNCSFYGFIGTYGLEDVHPGTAFNDPRIIPYARACQELAMASITAKPLQYAKDRAERAYYSLSLWPSDYAFDPLNWQNVPKIPFFRSKRDAEGQLIPSAALVYYGTLAMNTLALLYLVVLPVSAPSREQRDFFLFMAVFSLVFLIFAHAFNGAEQQRMRYTVHFLFWLLYALVAKDILRLFWRLGRRGETGIRA